MKRHALLTGFICVAAVAFRFAGPQLFETPPNWPAPVYDFAANPLTQPRVDLGRALFYDPLLSRNNMISCASCHSQYSAFTHIDHALSHGIEDRIGTRNSPVLINLAWQKSFMLDGAVNHLDMQPLAPLTHPREMDENLEHVISKLQASPLYPALFYRAFGDSVITGEHTLKAISQFMLTLVSSHSRYDSVMQKQAVFTEQENRGYQLFRQNCASCHAEPLFTNSDFRNNGLSVDTTLNDFGRYGVTRNPLDSLRFKVPTLRNIEFSYPYMHDGRFRNLSAVMTHYTSGIVHSPTLSAELEKPILLTSNEKVDIIAFLLTLSDKSFLFNPRFSYPREIFSGAAKE
jgi:cytochrome c peroxidase